MRALSTALLRMDGNTPTASAPHTGRAPFLVHAGRFDQPCRGCVGRPEKKHARGTTRDWYPKRYPKWVQGHFS